MSARVFNSLLCKFRVTVCSSPNGTIHAIHNRLLILESLKVTVCVPLSWRFMKILLSFNVAFNFLALTICVSERSFPISKTDCKSLFPVIVTFLIFTMSFQACMPRCFHHSWWFDELEELMVDVSCDSIAFEPSLLSSISASVLIVELRDSMAALPSKWPVASGMLWIWE